MALLLFLKSWSRGIGVRHDAHFEKNFVLQKHAEALAAEMFRVWEENPKAAAETYGL